MPDPLSPYAPPAHGGGPAPEGSPGARELPPSTPFVAALISLFMSGAGHVYARRYFRAVVWMCAPGGLLVLLALAVHAGARAFIATLWLVCILVVLTRIAVIVDAWWVVRRHPGPRAPVPLVVVGGIVSLVLVETAALGTRRFALEAFKIPSGSMIPTILVGDHVFVDKLRAPRRGDLVVFPFPEQPTQDFVKRIVGMPGDSVSFHDGHPTINGVEVPHCFVGVGSYEDPGSESPHQEGDLFVETLDGRPHLAFYTRSYGSAGLQGPFTVKSGEAFVVGDNRNNAHDSRMWFGGEGGGVPIATIKGVVFIVWLAVSDHGIDWSRTGLDLDGPPQLPTSMASLAPALAKCLEAPGGTK